MDLSLHTESEVVSFLKETDRPILLSVSGGKDSTALALYLLDLGIPFTPLFCDTGWEHELTYEYIRGPLSRKIGEVQFLRNESLVTSNPEEYGMVARILKYNLFPSGRIKWCTNELKLMSYRAYCVNLFLKERKLPISLTGVRGEESARRSSFGYVEEQDEATQIRPILKWSEDDVVEIHRKHGFPPNPLYLKGLSRVGCFPCIYTNKADLKKVADLAPERIDFLENLESRVSEARGVQATFFKKGGIREAVSWSRSQTDGMNALFTDEELGSDQVGCFRWGLCDRNPDQ